MSLYRDRPDQHRTVQGVGTAKPGDSPPGIENEEPEFVDEPDLPSEGEDDDVPDPKRVVHPAESAAAARST